MFDFIRRLTKLLNQVTVVDAFLRAEGGQLEPGGLLLFLHFLLRQQGRKGRGLEIPLSDNRVTTLCAEK